MPNYYIVKYLLENWIMRSVSLVRREKETDSLLAGLLRRGWRGSEKGRKPPSAGGEGEREAGPGGPVSHSQSVSRRKGATNEIQSAGGGVGGRR